MTQVNDCRSTARVHAFHTPYCTGFLVCFALWVLLKLVGRLVVPERHWSKIINYEMRNKRFGESYVPDSQPNDVNQRAVSTIVALESYYSQTEADPANPI